MGKVAWHMGHGASSALCQLGPLPGNSKLTMLSQFLDQLLYLVRVDQGHNIILDHSNTLARAPLPAGRPTCTPSPPLRY